MAFHEKWQKLAFLETIPIIIVCSSGLPRSFLTCLYHRSYGQFALVFFSTHAPTSSVRLKDHGQQKQSNVIAYWYVADTLPLKIRGSVIITIPSIWHQRVCVKDIWVQTVLLLLYYHGTYIRWYLPQKSLRTCERKIDLFFLNKLQIRDCSRSNQMLCTDQINDFTLHMHIYFYVTI